MAVARRFAAQVVTKPRKKHGNLVRRTFNLPEEFDDRLRGIAKLENRPVSNLILTLLQESVERKYGK